MVWEKLNTEMIKLNLEAKNTDQIFEKLGGEFVERGYCKESYVQALKDREAEFPTGITMASGGVAIPHTDASHVLKKGIAFATLKEPVQFVEMGTDDLLPFSILAKTASYPRKPFDFLYDKSVIYFR